jgi:hypothetical protein
LLVIASCSRVFFIEQISNQLVQGFSAVDENRKFITVFTVTHHCVLS